MPEGTVRWFDTERGFGFLALADGGDDLFVHASEILGGDGPTALREGQSVEFEIGEGDRGPQARRVRVTGDVAADATLGVLGTVAWYEPAKGYGFLSPEDGSAQIFVHSSAIVGGGVLHDDQRVAFLVVPGEKGPQADHVLPLAAAPGSGRASAGADADGADGTVTFFDADKGFGFISPDDGAEDVFVHARALGGGLRELSDGDRVTFEVVPGDRGPQARDVRLVGDPARRRSAGSSDRGRPERSRGGSGYGRPDRGFDRGSAPRGGSSRGGSARGGDGVVARYDADRGFGFIRPDGGGDDLFVHVSVVSGAEPLQEGDRVRYAVRLSDRGPQADRVERLH